MLKNDNGAKSIIYINMVGGQLITWLDPLNNKKKSIKGSLV